jgi:predicted RNase H-like nuclease (RuvC/YqgF family)
MDTNSNKQQQIIEALRSENEALKAQVAELDTEEVEKLPESVRGWGVWDLVQVDFHLNGEWRDAYVTSLNDGPNVAVTYCDCDSDIKAYVPRHHIRPFDKIAEQGFDRKELIKRLHQVKLNISEEWEQKCYDAEAWSSQTLEELEHKTEEVEELKSELELKTEEVEELKSELELRTEEVEELKSELAETKAFMKEKTLTLGEVEQFCNENYEDVLELNSVQDVKDLIGCL